MKGTLADFLHLVSRTPELAEKVVDLALEYDFEFQEEGMGDAELAGISGGAGDSGSGEGDLKLIALNSQISSHSSPVTVLTNMIKTSHDTRSAIINNLK